MIIFKTYTLGSIRNSQIASKNFFSKVYFRLILESRPKITFVISRIASMDFFEGCTHDYLQNIHPEKYLK